jgi:hypothetical protein
MNEPIFFYLSGTKIPEELVINKVGKDTISGYQRAQGQLAGCHHFHFR